MISTLELHKVCFKGTLDEAPALILKLQYVISAPLAAVPLLFCWPKCHIGSKFWKVAPIADKRLCAVQNVPFLEQF